jgi:hypothetical protein
MTEPQEADWDPKTEAARQLVRSAQTGELGYLVRRGGASMVKLDRPNSPEILRRYTPGDWLPEDTQRPLAALHAARIAFEADKALCRELGMRAHSMRDWAKLRDGERQLFTTTGPKSPPARAVLYASIMAAMKNFVRE